MKENISKYIVWGNMAIFLVIYILAASVPSFGSSLGAFFLTILHVLINLVIAIILSVIHIVKQRSNPTLGKAVGGFFLSAGLVLLVSFPTCLLVEKIRPVGL